MATNLERRVIATLNSMAWIGTFPTVRSVELLWLKLTFQQLRAMTALLSKSAKLGHSAPSGAFSNPAVYSSGSQKNKWRSAATSC